jgi:DNA topoisomerase-2
MLNVKDISREKFNTNEELTAIKKILGLEQGKKYENVTSMRYGRIMIMSDQDVDGFHIRGLLMNLFHTEWPELMKLGFLCCLMTPLVKMTRGSEVLCFYNDAELEAWKTSVGEVAATRYKSKYYKGLGTSTPAEAREWFENLSDIQYRWDPKTDKHMNLAFNKKLADDRKKWLATYNPKTNVMPVSEGTKRFVNYSSFVNDELIHFSNADNVRSLPHVMDGLKPSQRKILFGCFKRNLKQEIRVAQLAGYISEHAAYHHGEASLNMTITGMAQIFVGANNINLLCPVGQFGSRLMGGKDSASPRYIHTHMEPIVEAIFRKEDAPILKNLVDDGDIVEPETYFPVVPLLAINGSVGIGTGFSTDIPPHNPVDVVNCLRSRLDGGESLKGKVLDPWWIGFRGRVQKKEAKQWLTHAIYEWNDVAKSVRITELPVGTWTKDYKAFLDGMVQGVGVDSLEGGKPIMRSFEDLYNDVDVNFTLYLEAPYYAAAKKNPEEFEKRFHLTTSWKSSNMCCFDTKLNIVKYDTIGDILEEFYTARIGLYEVRRQHMIATLKDHLEELGAKWLFIRSIVDGSLKIMNMDDDVVLAGLKALNLPPRSDRQAPDSLTAYEYLLRMRVDRIKKKAVAEAEEEVIVIKDKLVALEKTTASELWKSDLDEFMQAWTSAEKGMLAVMSASKTVVKSKKFIIKKK